MSIDLAQYFDSAPQPPKTPSALDFISKLLLPALSLIAVIIGQIKGSPPSLQWVLLALTILSPIFGFAFAPFMTNMKERKERKRDIQATKDALPELRSLAETYSEFVHNGRPDTLHWIVQNDLCSGDGGLLAKLAIPPVELWYQLSVYFSQRTERHSSNPRDLSWTMMEFHYLVGSFNNLCVAAVFERLPKDLQPALTDRAKGRLNGFQQRFTMFLKSYEDYVKRLEKSRPVFQNLPRSFAWPKPL